MSDQTPASPNEGRARPIVEIYDRDGHRLYTLGQLADLTGQLHGTVRQWHKRGRKLGEPAGWVDERTPTWRRPARRSELWAPGFPKS